MAVIIGLSNSKDSGACLMVDGALVAAVNEERLTREKLTNAFPARSIQWLLSEGGIAAERIDACALGVWKGVESWDIFPRYVTEAMERSAAEPMAAEAIASRVRASAASDTRQLEALRVGMAELGLDRRPLIHCHHHEAHGYSAFAFSPFERALVVTLDGRGDFCSGMVSVMRRGEMPRVLRQELELDSLGAFYGWITRQMGFIPDRHEGKVTGLAAQGEPGRCLPVLRRMIGQADGRLRGEIGPFYRPHMRAALPVLEAALEPFSRQDIAAAAQALLEETVAGYVAHYLAATGETNLCVAGGIFANVLLNKRIKDMDGLQGFFVFPHMGDGGIPAGAAAGAAERLGDRVQPLASAYLGPGADEADLAASLAASGMRVERPDDFAGRVVDHIQGGAIVGFFEGRTEFGPRALGARSILASATDPSINGWLNERLHRSEFMPFAPVVIEEIAAECFPDWRPDHRNAWFMTCCYACSLLMIEKAPAVVHVDGTARPQVVSAERNGAYYQVVRRYWERTGIPALINTSFNRHEEPIISSLTDATAELGNGSIDVLAAPPFVVTRT